MVAQFNTSPAVDAATVALGMADLTIIRGYYREVA